MVPLQHFVDVEADDVVEMLLRLDSICSLIHANVLLSITSDIHPLVVKKTRQGH